MADSEQYIEIIAQARLARAIEYYRAEITLNVTTRKKDACLNEALSLRADVLAALADAGLSEDQIQDGSGSFEQSNWSSSKHNTQVIHVEHVDMKVLIQAMARVEAVFASRKQGFWSPIKHNFTFGAPQPVYTFDPDAADKSLSAAVRDAQTQATELAKQAGFDLSGVISIVQISRAPLSPPASSNGLGMVSHFSESMLNFDADDSYTPSVARQDSGSNTYRVRFAVHRGA